MSIPRVGTVVEVVIGDRRRLSVEWADALKPEGKVYPPLARDKIAESAWSLHADSPQTAGLTLIGAGFEPEIGVAWVSIESDGTIAADDKFWIVNEITTTGIMPSAQLSTKTSDQVLKRMIVVQFKAAT